MTTAVALSSFIIICVFSCVILSVWNVFKFSSLEELWRGKGVSSYKIPTSLQNTQFHLYVVVEYEQWCIISC